MSMISIVIISITGITNAILMSVTERIKELRVQVSPRMSSVAVRLFQHSPLLGQWASSHTVCRRLDRIRCSIQ